MDEKKRDETRRMLKIFGIAVTDFEEESKELLSRVQSLEAGASDELVGTLRDLLELISETNEKWQTATEYLFGLQRRVLADVVRLLS
jgi:hypothetical protein